MESDEKNRFVDNWLDQALWQRGAIEPRPGLERRILANLRAQDDHTPRTARWWPVLAAAAVALIIAAAILMSTPRHRATNVAAGQPGAPQVLPPQVHDSSPAVSDSANRQRIPRRPSKPQRQEQFPSPQPLSEQEQLLAAYVQQFRWDAVLVAEAQTELLKQEMLDQEIPRIEIPAISDPVSDQSNP